MSQGKDNPTPHEIIKQAIESVCSEGNSDPHRVTLDIVRALERGGWEFKRVPEFNDWGRVS